MNMRLGIDASNLRDGGGITHLQEILRAAEPARYGFGEIIVWGGSSTLNSLDSPKWLRKSYHRLLDGSLPARLYWQRFVLDRLAQEKMCDLLFVPGGSYSGSFRPFVTMCRNMLPFQPEESRRYGISYECLRSILLRRSQSQTFCRADGVIFLTQFAQDTLRAKIGKIQGRSVTISHGVSRRFCSSRRHSNGQFTFARPFRWLYVSIVDVYKHQWTVVEAVAKLRRAGLPVTLDLIGPAYPPALKRLEEAIHRYDPMGEFVTYHGRVPFEALHSHYETADGFVFASSCENLPNILLEAMASGLPIACSNRGPMPEVLGNAGLYFDPERSDEIESALGRFMNDATLRQHCSDNARELARAFTWEKTAQDTFSFLAEIARGSYEGPAIVMAGTSVGDRYGAVA